MSLLRSSAFRLLLLTLPALGAFAQANPDMRPYRAVEQQQLRANVQIILDSSLNMKKDMGANTPLAAEASTGSWVCVSGTNAQIGCSGGSPATIKSRYSYAGPSREAIIKNLLGNSVSLVDFPSGTTNVSGCVSNPTCTGAIAPAAPSGAINTLAPADLLYKTAFTNTRFNPGLELYPAPTDYTATNTVTMNTASAASACESNLIRGWLTAGGTPVAGASIVGCSVTPASFTSQIPVGAEDANAGLALSGYVNNAVAAGNATAYTTAVCGVGNNATVPAAPADPSASCNRSRFNILVVGGAATNCNPANTAITYAACPGTASAPVAGSPAEKTRDLYAGTYGTAVRTFVVALGAEASANSGNYTRQEWNMAAAFGKTDANDPYKLGGVRLMRGHNSSTGAELVDASNNPIYYPADPFLRAGSEYVLSDGTNNLAPVTGCLPFGTGSNTFSICPGTGYLCSHDYAYFAVDTTSTVTNVATYLATRQVASHFANIFSALSVGDYTTETPAIATHVFASNTLLKDIIYTASISFPGFYGHLRAQDLNICVTFDGTPVLCNDPKSVGFELINDAGQVLANQVAATTSGATTRKIYTIDTTAASLITDGAGTRWPLVQLTDSVASATALSANYNVVTGATTCKNSSGATVTCMTQNVVKYLLGYNSSGVARSWVLGDIINSQPVVLTPPGFYGQGVTYNHDAFQTTYGIRRPLIIVGASDGMIHAFDAGTLDEIWAFIPPDALVNIGKQYWLNFLPSGETGMGQPSDPDAHLFGVAAGANFTDVDLKAPDTTLVGGSFAPVSDWRTLLVGGLGKGGPALFGLDVTHSYPGNGLATTNPAYIAPDPGYSATDPIKVMWYKSAKASSGPASGLPTLGETWSTPSIVLDNYTRTVSVTLPSPQTAPVVGRWVVNVGSGPVNSGSTEPGFPARDANASYSKGVFMNVLNAKDGSLLKAYQLGTGNNGIIASTTISGGVGFSTNQIDFADKISNRFYQADTSGRIWEANTGDCGIDFYVPPATSGTRFPSPPNTCLAPAGSYGSAESTYWPGASAVTSTNSTPLYTDQPVYDGPAVGYYQDTPDILRPFSVMAWAGGSYFENTGTMNNCSGCFESKLYFRAQDLSFTPAYSTAVNTVKVDAIAYTNSGAPKNFSANARTIGPPALYIPVVINSQGSAVDSYPPASDIRAIYAVYDPTPSGGASCSGISGFAELQPFGSNSHVAGATGPFNAPALLQAKYVAEGAASAPVIYNGYIIMNVSSKYSYAAARVGGIDNQANGSGAANVKIASWREIF